MSASEPAPGAPAQSEAEAPRTLWERLRAEGGRVLRFVLVGGGLFALDLAIFLALVEGLALGVGWAQLLSVSVRTVVGFFAHKWFTFRGDTADTATATAGQGVAYLVQALINVPLSAALVVGTVWLLGGWELGGKLLMEGIMIAEVYVLYRFVVYGRALFGRRD